MQVICGGDMCWRLYRLHYVLSAIPPAHIQDTEERQKIHLVRVIGTGNLRLARKVAPKGERERENELLFIIAAQSILASYAPIWPALLKQPAGGILSRQWV